MYVFSTDHLPALNILLHHGIQSLYSNIYNLLYISHPIRKQSLFSFAQFVHFLRELCLLFNFIIQKIFPLKIYKKCKTTLQMFYMLFLQSYVCQPNPQTKLSNFNSLIPVIKKRQFNAVFTVLQNGFLHVFVCNF